VLTFKLKNAHSKFQHVMNNILNEFSEISIVYINDVLMCSKILDQRFKHVKTFFNAIKRNGLAVSAPK